MSGAVEVRSTGGWQRLDVARQPPRILETETVLLRGLRPGQRVRVGRTELVADGATTGLRPAADEHLSGHVGLVEVAVDDVDVGEIELVADKMSEEAYRILRADLQRLWTDLVFDVDGLAAVRAGPPPARELWRRVDRPLRQILERPNEQLGVGTVVRRMEHVRRPRELRPAVVRAGIQGRPALTRTVERTIDTPENRLCVATLLLLRSHALRDPSAGPVAERVQRTLRHPVLAGTSPRVGRITWGMRSDARYRQVLEVHRLLQRPELEPTEGPGELRLGVPGLARLYEYWVFLQVLSAAMEHYGRPVDRGFSPLAVPLAGGRRRLELPGGTTVTFPGNVRVAFEPRFTARGDGWMGVEYVPHPDRHRQQLVATPDVVVLRSGEHPSMTVIDAKYVGRSWVETESARVHEKYARMRLGGTSIVRNVLVAHPHHGLAQQWAGYGHLPMVPGATVPPLPLPLPLP